MSNARRLLVGIDLGTTGTRCMIFDTGGRCISSAYAEYPLIHRQNGWVEQSVPVMLETTARVWREAAARPASTLPTSRVLASRRRCAPRVPPMRRVSCCAR